MNPLKEFFESGQTVLWIETQNTVAFLRPVPDILVWTPCPTACLAESLRLRQVRFTSSEGLLRPLLFAQIEHESDPFVPSFEECAAQQHRHAAAVFPEVLLLESLKDPVAFNSATARSSRSRHSAGVRSVQRTRPEAISSWPYCTMWRNASLAATIAPSRVHMTTPTTLESTKRRILSSVVLRSVMSVTAPINSMFPDSVFDARATIQTCFTDWSGNKRRHSTLQSFPSLDARSICS